MVDDKAPLSRSMLLRNDVNVNLVLEGKNIVVVIPSALFTIEETGKLVNHDECVHMIYGSILLALSPNNCSWFSREKYEMAWRTDFPGQEFPVGFDFAYLIFVSPFPPLLSSPASYFQ